MKIVDDRLKKIDDDALDTVAGGLTYGPKEGAVYMCKATAPDGYVCNNTDFKQIAMTETTITVKCKRCGAEYSLPNE